MNQKIGFAQELIESVLDGSKTLTYRLGSKYADTFKKGQIVDAENSNEKEIFAQLRLVEINKLKMSEIDLNQDGHEKYSSLDQLVASMQKYYPKADVSEDTVISQILFEVI